MNEFEHYEKVRTKVVNKSIQVREERPILDKFNTSVPCSLRRVHWVQPRVHVMSCYLLEERLLFWFTRACYFLYQYKRQILLYYKLNTNSFYASPHRVRARDSPGWGWSMFASTISLATESHIASLCKESRIPRLQQRYAILIN